MSSDSGDTSDRPGGQTRRRPPDAQGASRGGFRPEDLPDGDERPSSRDDTPSGGERRSTGDPPFGGYPFGNDDQTRRGPGGWGASSTDTSGARFLGMPVKWIYAIGAAILGIVFIGAFCGGPSTATGSVAGQVKTLNADRSVATLAGAQIVLRGNNQTYTATSVDVPASAEGEAAYNYRIENVPPGTYAMTVTAPAGANYQTEDNQSVTVKSGKLFPKSVMLIADGIQKPRQLAENDLQPGEAGGYVNDKGERVTYQQNGGFDASDALLMYLLWRNPPFYGYGAPPVMYTPSSTGSNYRVADPPTRTSSGQTVTQSKPQTPGQGATRPSSNTGVTGSGPNTSSSSSTSKDAVAPGQSGTSNSGANTSTQTKPSTSTGGSTVTQPSAPSAPSQGATRPSSSTSRPSTSSAPSRSSGSSGGGRR